MDEFQRKRAKILLILSIILAVLAFIILNIALSFIGILPWHYIVIIISFALTFGFLCWRLFSCNNELINQYLEIVRSDKIAANDGTEKNDVYFNEDELKTRLFSLKYVNTKDYDGYYFMKRSNGNNGTTTYNFYVVACLKVNNLQEYIEKCKLFSTNCKEIEAKNNPKNKKNYAKTFGLLIIIFKNYSNEFDDQLKIYSDGVLCDNTKVELLDKESIKKYKEKQISQAKLTPIIYDALHKKIINKSKKYYNATGERENYETLKNLFDFKNKKVK